MFTQAIKENRKQMEFHREKSTVFLRWAWVFSFLGFVVILVFAEYTKGLLETVAQAHIQTNAQVSNIPLKDVSLPDFVGLINENYFGYWAVSGFILALLSSLGMLKYHTNRMTYFESEISTLNKLQSISTLEDARLELAKKLIESCLSNEQRASPKVVLNPILDAISESASKVIDKLSPR